MAFSQNIHLFGSNEACERACVILENLHEIRRIDRENNELRILFTSPLSEMELLEILKKSSISGFSIHR